MEEPRILTVIHFLNAGTERPLIPGSPEFSKFWLALTETERAQFTNEAKQLQGK